MTQTFKHLFLLSISGQATSSINPGIEQALEDTTAELFVGWKNERPVRAQIQDVTVFAADTMKFSVTETTCRWRLAGLVVGNNMPHFRVYRFYGSTPTVLLRIYERDTTTLNRSLFKDYWLKVNADRNRFDFASQDHFELKVGKTYRFDLIYNIHNGAMFDDLVTPFTVQSGYYSFGNDKIGIAAFDGIMTPNGAPAGLPIAPNPGKGYSIVAGFLLEKVRSGRVSFAAGS